jgi:curved DNA-binding protein CbpA
MTFYEELGVPPDAPPDTIRDAYRNVARLLHPDAQTNPVLKESAETQMKRINHLYGVLSDPERRRRYDQELAEPPDRTGTIIIQAPPQPNRLQRGNGGTFVWLAATAIGAAFILWLATRESSMPAVYPQPSSGQSADVPALRKTAAAILPTAGSGRQRDDEIARLRGELAVAIADRERLQKQIAAMQGERRFQLPPSNPGPQARVTPPGSPNPVSLTPAPLAAQASALEISLPSASQRPIPPPPPPPLHTEPPALPKVRWAGSWAFNGPRADNRKEALFPPEFIETVISEENGRIHGRYHARFKVADARISPDVDFRFEGRVSGISGRFAWTGTGGAKGEVQLRLVSDTTLEVVWGATDLGKSMGLASGTAVLNRKN